jgi:hypothetical protein
VCRKYVADEPPTEEEQAKKEMWERELLFSKVFSKPEETASKEKKKVENLTVSEDKPPFFMVSSSSSHSSSPMSFYDFVLLINGGTLPTPFLEIDVGEASDGDVNSLKTAMESGKDNKEKKLGDNDSAVDNESQLNNNDKNYFPKIVKKSGEDKAEKKLDKNDLLMDNKIQQSNSDESLQKIIEKSGEDKIEKKSEKNDLAVDEEGSSVENKVSEEIQLFNEGTKKRLITADENSNPEKIITPLSVSSMFSSESPSGSHRSCSVSPFSATPPPIPKGDEIYDDLFLNTATPAKATNDIKSVNNLEKINFVNVSATQSQTSFPSRHTTSHAPSASSSSSNPLPLSSSISSTTFAFVNPPTSRFPVLPQTPQLFPSSTFQHSNFYPTKFKPISKSSSVPISPSSIPVSSSSVPISLSSVPTSSSSLSSGSSPSSPPPSTSSSTPPKTSTTTCPKITIIKSQLTPAVKFNPNQFSFPLLISPLASNDKNRLKTSDRNTAYVYPSISKMKISSYKYIQPSLSHKRSSEDGTYLSYSSFGDDYLVRRTLRPRDQNTHQVKLGQTREQQLMEELVCYWVCKTKIKYLFLFLFRIFSRVLQAMSKKRK